MLLDRVLGYEQPLGIASSSAPCATSLCQMLSAKLRTYRAQHDRPGGIEHSETAGGVDAEAGPPVILGRSRPSTESCANWSKRSWPRQTRGHDDQAMRRDHDQNGRRRRPNIADRRALRITPKPPTLERFPDARPVATAAVVADIKATGGRPGEQWQARFGDDVDKTGVVPEPLDGDVIELEGHELRVIEVAQGDIAPSTVVHIPSIDTVIGGDSSTTGST